MYTYLLINLLSISVPLIASFDKRLNFYKKWKYFFPGLILTLLFFIAWDVLYTHWGIWGFNERYLTGMKIINLPVEEWLFFISIPYACVFTYDALNYLVKKDLFKPAEKYISAVLIGVLVIVAVWHYNRLYTSVTFLLTALFIALHQYVWKSPWISRFYFTYLIILIPFFIVNGILTGSFIEEEVVYYDNTMNLGIRLLTIPIEDSIYGMLLIMMNVAFYEWFQKRSKM